ncbi:MAG: hypothetical protein DMG05_19760 [Acidobacteria bacterium]|nr:MAG: hypothetical protein DMG05_19760 [Acidobacteriota bacterium]
MKPTAPTSFMLTKTYPKDGLNEVPDQLAPPRVPGISKVSSSPQGLKMRPGRVEPKFSRQYWRDSGVTVVMSSRVTKILPSGGGLMGKGWVGQVASPGTLLCGTGRSSTGNKGSPVRRSSTNMNPIFVT